MNKLFGVAVVAMLASPIAAFAQGVTQYPPSPNASNSEPESPNSLPPGARTLAPGSTGIQQMGTLTTTQVEPPPPAYSAQR